MAGDAVTGVTAITLADRMDAGEMLAKESLAIGPTDTTGELHDRLAHLGPAVLGAVLTDAEAGELSPQAQDESAVTLAPKLSRADAALDATMTAVAMRRMINGCSPWPGCAARIGGEKLKLLKAAPVEVSVPNGSVTQCGDVGCEGGAMRLLVVQPVGGRPMSFEQWSRGRRLEWPSTIVVDMP